MRDSVYKKRKKNRPRTMSLCATIRLRRDDPRDREGERSSAEARSRNNTLVSFSLDQTYIATNISTSRLRDIPRAKPRAGGRPRGEPRVLPSSSGENRTRQNSGGKRGNPGATSRIRIRGGRSRGITIARASSSARARARGASVASARTVHRARAHDFPRKRGIFFP